MTTVGDQLYHFGGTPVGEPVTQGSVFYMRPTGGGNASNGRTPRAAVKTLAGALAKCRADRNDIVKFLSESNTSAVTTDYQTDTLAWSKDGTHLMGVNSGSILSSRSRIAWKSTATSATDKPLLLLSGNNCLIEGVSVFAGINDANLGFGVKVTGDRNVFRRCHLAGIGHDTNDVAGAYSLEFSGGDENLFEDCVIGLDTIARGTATNTEVLFSAGSNARNVFRRCIFVTYAEAADHTFVKRVSGGSDRFTLFDCCTFINTGTTTMNQAFDVTAGGSPAGQMILVNPAFFGVTDVETTPSGAVKILAMPKTAADNGIGSADLAA